jgi:type II secretory pathway pseudopilin PulG
MATPMIGRGGNFRLQKHAEGGVSLIEVVISMAVLTVGMVSMLGVFGLAMASTQTSQQDTIAKQLANESYESIITARNTTQISWVDLQNVSNGGIFVDGAQPIYNAGVDGIFGTADDAAAGEQTLQDPGADGIYQTADDILIPLTGYKRTILISPVKDTAGNTVTTLRSVTITVQYATSQSNMSKTYTLNSFVSQYQ